MPAPVNRIQTNDMVRRVVLLTSPTKSPMSTADNPTYYCMSVDMKGFQIQVDLQALPPGVSISQLQPNQVWWVERRTTLFRLYLYSGVMDPVTRSINTDSPLPVNATEIQGIAVSSTTPTNGQVLEYNSTISGWIPTTLSGGSSGNATQLQGYPIATTAPASGQVLGWNGADWIPTTPSGSSGGSGITQLTGDVTAGPGSGSQAATLQATTNVENIISNNPTVTTLSGNFVTLSGQLATVSGVAYAALPISGGTVSGNLVVASGLTVSGALTVGSEVDTGAMTVGGNLTVTGTTTLNNTLAANSGITLGQATNINFLTGGGYQLSVSGSNPGTIIIPGPGLGSTDTLATLNGTQTLSNKTLATTTVSGNLVVASGLTVSGTVTATGIQISESQVTNLTTDLAAKFPYSGGTISGNLTVASGLTVSGGINISGTLAYNGQTVPSTNYIANYNSGYGPATGYVLTYNPGLGVIYNNSITGGLILQGASSVQSTLTVTSGLTVTGTTTLGSGYVSVSGSGTSGYITVGGAGGLVSAANINGTSGVFSSSLTSSGTLFVTGTSTHVGNATFSGTITSNAYLPNVASITATSNAATVSGSTYTSTKVTNNSAATLAITMSTTGAVDGMQAIVRILDFSAVAQTISWTNTENSQVSAPTTSNGSTTLPLTVGFIYNGSTSKWRCVAVA